MADRQIEVAGEVKDASDQPVLAGGFTPPFEAHETDLYHILGVPADYEPDQIKWAYRRLLLQYHPDKNTQLTRTSDLPPGGQPRGNL